MNHTTPALNPDRPAFGRRIPTAAWVITGALVAALVAIFVFKVAVSTVITYGFLGAMILSHLFMHGSHGGHGGHANHAGHAGGAQTAPSASVDGPANAGQTGSDQQAGHTGGCH
jgi:hypothetical protein